MAVSDTTLKVIPKKTHRFKRPFFFISFLCDIRILLVLGALAACVYEGRLPRLEWLDNGLFRAGLYLKAEPTDKTEPVIITLPEGTLRAVAREPDNLTDLFSLLDKLRRSAPSGIALVMDDCPLLSDDLPVSSIESKINEALEKAGPSEKKELTSLLAYTRKFLVRGQTLADSLERAGVIVALTHDISRGIPVTLSGHYGMDLSLAVAPPRVTTHWEALPHSALTSIMPEIFPLSDTTLWQGQVTPVRLGGQESDWPLVWKENDRYLPDLITLMFAQSLKTKATWEKESGLMFGFSFVNTDPAGFVKPRFSDKSRIKTTLAEYTLGEILKSKSLSFVKKRPVFIGSAQDPTLTGAALAYLSLSSGAVSHVPFQALWLGKFLIIGFLVYLIILTPLVRPLTALIISIAIVAVLVLFQMGVHLITDQFLPMALPFAFLFVGHGLMLVRQQIRRRLSELDEKAQAAFFELGNFQYEQNRFDQAFLSLKNCKTDDRVLETLYKLGVSLERKRQFDKACNVFDYITESRPSYRDAGDRSAQLSQILFGRTAAGPGLSTNVSGAAPNLSRSVLGRYEIERELGRGAMGVVYLGKDPKINRSIAIKTMDFTQTFEGRFDEVKERFFREAMAAGRLTHPNIVTIFDAGEEQDLAYIAMDYVEGKALNEFSRPETLLPVPVVFHIMAQVADALDYAHKQQIIHRDIKPGNIIYNPQDNIVKVTDFGIARIADTTTTRPGVVVGSPSFMSPEQLKGKEIDGRADIFSLGVTFYQLLTGTLPFKGNDLSSLGYQITSVKHAPASSLRGGIPKIADSIIDKALQKNPANRYKAAGGMARSLRTDLNGVKTL